MTFNINHLSHITNLPYPLLVKLPNGYKVKVTKVGDVKVNDMITLFRVLFIPSFKYNLISISSLSLNLNCTVSFSNSSCILQGPSTKRPLEIGREQDGLYFLCSDCLKRKKDSPFISNVSSSILGSQCQCFSHSCSSISHSCSPLIKSQCDKSFVMNNVLSDSMPLLHHESCNDLLWH